MLIIFHVLLVLGSFTGLRIGIATTKSFCMAKAIPTIGVTSLETLAYNVKTPSSIICSLIDAKNDNAYCGIFDKNYNPLEDFFADHIDNIINKLKKYQNITFVGNGALLHQHLLAAALTNCNFISKNTQSAYSLGLCANKKYNNGNIQNADNLLPLYLRKSQAERQVTGGNK